MVIIKKYFSSATVKLLSLSVQFIWLGVLSKYFGTQITGEYLEMYFYLGMLTLFSNLGFNEFLLKNFKNFFSNNFLKDTVTSFILCTIQVLFSIPILYLFNLLFSELELVIGISYVALQSFLDIGCTRLRSIEKGSAGLFFLLLLPNFIFLVSVQSNFVLNLNIDLIRIMIFSMFLAVFFKNLYFLYFLKSIPQNNTRNFISVLAKLFSNKKTLLNFYVLQLITFIISQGDLFIVSILLDPEQFGLYSIAIKIGVFSTIGLMAFNIRSKHEFANAFDLKKYHIIDQLEKNCFYLSMPTPIILFFFMIILFLSPIEYLFNWNLNSLLPIAITILFYQQINMLLGPVNSIATMSGYPQYVIRARIVAFIFSLLLLAFLFNNFDAKVAIINFAGLNLILWKVITSYYLYKKTNISTGWTRLINT